MKAPAFQSFRLCVYSQIGFVEMPVSISLPESYRKYAHTFVTVTSVFLWFPIASVVY